MNAIRARLLVLFATLLLAIAIALGAWINATVWAAYETTSEITLSDYDAGANADVTADIEIPAENLLFDELITFYPPQWGIAAEGDVEVGTVVGDFSMDATVGLLNGACNNSLPVSCRLANSAASPLSGIIVDPDDMFDPVCPGGRERAVCQWPGFLSELFPDLTPRARYYCHSGSSFVNILVFEPGTSLYGVDFPADWGYGSVTVISDPSALEGTPPTPNPITDFCAPLTTFESINATAGAAVPLRTNPSQGGSYTFRVWSRGALDGDGDGYENAIDTCPFDVNVDASPRTSLGDPDGDGIDSACEPRPCCAVLGRRPRRVQRLRWGLRSTTAATTARSIANANQADADNDRIGDACDPDPDDSLRLSRRRTSPTNWRLRSRRPGAGETPTPTPNSVADAWGDGHPHGRSSRARRHPARPRWSRAKTCAPVIPATYNGLVRLNGVPAASGYGDHRRDRRDGVGQRRHFRRPLRHRRPGEAARQRALFRRRHHRLLRGRRAVHSGGAAMVFRSARR